MELRLDRHEVQVGETVQSIATQTGIPIEQLRKWNRLFGNEVYPTQIIYLRDPSFPFNPYAVSGNLTSDVTSVTSDSEPPFISFLDEPEQADSASTLPPVAPVANEVSLKYAISDNAMRNSPIIRGQTPPPPHDADVLYDIITDEATNRTVNEGIAAAIAHALVQPVTISDAPSIPRPKMTISTRKLEGVGTVLTPERSELLRDTLPIFIQDETLTLLYSVLTHGSDMASFFSHTKGYQYSVIIIQACSGEIFGGFAAGAWRQSTKYYGHGESYVFEFVDNHSAIIPSLWTRENDFFLWSDATSVAMGGGGNGFSFIISDDFHNGNTNRSNTFNNRAFVADNSFKVDSVEVWGFKKYFDGKLAGSSARRR